MGINVRVIGIDTSLRSTGFGIVEARGHALSNVANGTIRNTQKMRHTQCLRHLAEDLAAVITETDPAEAAIEGIFHFKNARTAVTLGQARGVALAVCAQANIPVYEYPPRRVKQAVVGTGTAGKEQVGRMVVRLLGLDAPPQVDAADALAIAICHIHQRKLPLEMGSKEI